MASILESASRELAAKPRADQLVAIREAVQALPDDQKKAFADALVANIAPPDQNTSNTVWLIIIWAFVLVMSGAVVTLCTSVFVAPIKDATKPDTILTVFTTSTAFLAGLFAPSPMSSKKVS